MPPRAPAEPGCSAAATASESGQSVRRGARGLADWVRRGLEAVNARPRVLDASAGTVLPLPKPIERENRARSVDPCNSEQGCSRLDPCDSTRRQMPFEPLEGAVQLRPVTRYGEGKGRRTSG